MKRLQITSCGAYSRLFAGGSLPVILLLVHLVPVAAQPRFEVATVKPDVPGVRTSTRAIGGPGTPDPGRVYYDHRTLRALLMTAFDEFEFQIKGPAWLDSEKYSVECLVPPGTDKQGLQSMLKNLIVDRFAIVYTTEERPTDGFLLSLDGGAGKLTSTHPPVPDSSPLRLLPKRFEFVQTRVTEGFLQKGSMRGSVRLAGFSVAPDTLTRRLSELLQCPIEDGTGLTGFYDMDLVFSLEQATFGPDNVDTNVPTDRPDLFTAIREQLGLKLVRKKINTSIIIIQSAQKVPRTDQ